MDAGALLVGDVVAQLEQVVPELPVDAQQAVLGAAGQVELGAHGLLGHLFGQGVVVVDAAPHLGELPKHGLVVALVGHEEIGVLGVLQHGVQNQRGGKGRHGAEGLGMLQAVDNGPKAAHGKAAQEGILPPGGQGEGAPGEVHQLLADEPAVIGAGLGVIHIEAVVAAGHHHSQVAVLGPALHPGAADPVGIVAEDAVEQVQGFKGTLRRRAAGAQGFVGGQHHLDGHGAHQGLGEEIALEQCHREHILCFFLLLYRKIGGTPR